MCKHKNNRRCCPTGSAIVFAIFVSVWGVDVSEGWGIGSRTEA